MKWETPTFVEINMSAEIGGYGGDFSDRDPLAPIAAPARAAVSGAAASADTPAAARR